jgi:hypothetical protein
MKRRPKDDRRSASQSDRRSDPQSGRRAHDGVNAEERELRLREMMRAYSAQQKREDAP